MSTLQQALAALQIQPAVAARKAPPKARPDVKARRAPPKPAPARVHRCEFNTFSALQPLRLAVDDDTGRFSESRPPPEHEPCFAEQYFPPVETLVIRRDK